MVLVSHSVIQRNVIVLVFCKIVLTRLYSLLQWELQLEVPDVNWNMLNRCGTCTKIRAEQNNSMMVPLIGRTVDQSNAARMFNIARFAADKLKRCCFKKSTDKAVTANCERVPFVYL